MFGQNTSIDDSHEVGVFIFLFSPYLPAQLHEERNGSCNRKIRIEKDSILIEKMSCTYLFFKSLCDTYTAEIETDIDRSTFKEKD